MNETPASGVEMDGLAANIASSVLRELALELADGKPPIGPSQRPGGEPDSEPGFKCTGVRYACDDYSCVGTDHRCDNDYRCGHFRET